ncbi:MAG: hypothetical protein NVS3B7_05660 [Candidatus Elarobacter sp.]
MRSHVAALLLAFAPAVTVLISPVPAPAGESAPGSAPASTALSRRGSVTSRAAAESAIAFRPFVPDDAPTEVALLPPFNGSAALAVNEGIGYAYGRHGRAWVLTQWPRNGGDLRAFAALAPEARCTDVHAIGGKHQPRGVVWSTPRGFVFSLTPDGSAEPRTIVAEFRRLVSRGACR